MWAHNGAPPALFSFLKYFPLCTGGATTNNEIIKPNRTGLKPQKTEQDTKGSTTYALIRTHYVHTLLLCVVFLAPLFANAGVFSTLLGKAVVATGGEDDAPVHAYTAQTVPLLQGATNVDPHAALGGGDIVIDEDGTLVPDLGPSGGNDAVTSNGEINTYVVREHDSLSEIASMFGVSVNTILWANDIKNSNTIQPGDTLVVLPVSGVRHVVKKGDTLKSIAAKYQGDVADIVNYNRLTSEGDIAPGQTVVVPGGEVMPPPAPKKSSGVAKNKSGSAVTGGGKNISGYFANPLPGGIKTQGIHGYNGVDIGAPAGTPIRAAAAGSVILSRSSGYNGGYGNYVVVKHVNGTQTLYAHMSSVVGSAGQSVAQGEVIGYVGNTGRSTGPHLHFEIRGARNPF